MKEGEWNEARGVKTRPRQQNIVYEAPITDHGGERAKKDSHV